MQVYEEQKGKWLGLSNGVHQVDIQKCKGSGPQHILQTPLQFF